MTDRKMNLLYFEPNYSTLYPVPICEVEKHQLPAGGAAAVNADWRRPSSRRAGVLELCSLHISMATSGAENTAEC